MSYRITITNLDADEVMLDTSSDGFILAYDAEDRAGAMTALDLTAQDICHLAAVARIHADLALAGEPALVRGFADRLYRQMKRQSADRT